MRSVLALFTVSLLIGSAVGCGKDETLPAGGGSGGSVGAGGSGVGTGGQANPGSGGSGPGSTPCAASDCQNQPVPAIGCADAEAPVFTCDLGADGACHWSGPNCPVPPTKPDAAADTGSNPPVDAGTDAVGVACGPKTCPIGEYCCNAGCGLCAPKNAACIAAVCEPPPPDAGQPGEPCGTKTCNPGDVCCSPSCGICGRKGGACPAIACGPGPVITNPCKVDDDCRLFDDYCTGCDCRALAKTTKDPVCSGPGVRCLVEPCASKKAACVNNVCVAR
ncbi:MAG TPA: hypothetical protein VH374_05900 [Polyangia bacterium]|jgi:hypothetical protein|nr:hypothetical protein [Polyangia bacterium]